MLLLLYNLLLPFALIISFPFYLRRMLKRGGYAKGFLQRFGLYSPELSRRLGGRQWSWVRAVSVGEVGMALRLVEELKRQSPDFRAVISTTTSTGYALAQRWRGSRDWIEIVYNPVDFYPIVQKCWKKFRPSEAILIDSDLWPSFLAIAKSNACPVFLANARLSQRSERRYTMLRALTHPLFWRNLTTLFAQDAADAERWTRVGFAADKIVVTGSVKYDTENLTDGNNSHFRVWLKNHGIDSRRPILLGGSLHRGEEELLISCFKSLLVEFPDLFLILVPRHAERAPEIAQVLRASNLPFTLRFDPDFEANPSVLVVNSTGELREWYAIATVVVVGKSFCGTGGQNPVEPILASKPVVVGPHMENFQYIVDALRKAGGIVQLPSADSLVSTIADLLRDPSAAAALVSCASEAIAQHKGSIRRTASAILATRTPRTTKA